MSLITAGMNQSKVFYYKQALTSEGFNKVFSKTMPLGIYEGGEFSRIVSSNNTFTINPFSIVIEARNKASYDVAVRIRIMEVLTAEIVQDISYPLIVARFTWTEGSEDNLDILQVSETAGVGDDEYNPTDIILGKLNLIDNAGTIELIAGTDFVDYTQKNWSLFTKDVLKNNFLVRAGKENSIDGEVKTRVYIESGLVRTKSGIKNLVGASSSDIVDTVAARIDYIYIDESGAIQVQQGSTSGSVEPYYGRKVIAEIRRGANRDSIYGSEIFNFNEVPFGTINADTLTIDNANGCYSGTNITIEEALDLAWEKIVRQVIDEDQKTFSHVDGLKIESGPTKNAIIIKAKDVGTLSKALTITNKALSANRTLTLPDGDAEILAGIQVTAANTDQSVDGIKTFVKIPKVPTNTTENTGVVPKSYVDNISSYLTTHKDLTTESTETTVPHGIKQGTGNGFDADKLDGADLDTDITLATNSDAKIPSQKAVKTFVGSEVTSAIETLGSSGNAYSATRLETSRDLNGVSFDGRADTTVPANLTKDEDSTANQFVTFVAVDGGGNKALKQSSKLKFNPSTGELTTTTIYIISSREKKDDIKDYSDLALDIVNSAEIKTFSYKDDKTKNIHVGIIAEDAPDVMTSKDKKTFAMSDTIGVMLKAIQELSDEVKDLKTRIEYLEEIK